MAAVRLTEQVVLVAQYPRAVEIVLLSVAAEVALRRQVFLDPSQVVLAEAGQCSLRSSFR